MPASFRSPGATLPLLPQLDFARRPEDSRSGSAPPAGIHRALAAEWRTLLRERDPELHAEGFLHLARRLEARGDAAHLAAAQEIYSSLGEGSEVPGEVSRRALLRLEVLAGRGPTGTRVERLMGGFVRQATDPALLLGLGFASGVFQATRFAVLARLAASPSSSFLTRGLGARVLAGSAGLALEAPVFTAATRMGHVLQGVELDWSREALGTELASGYLTLGALKLSGGLVSNLAFRNAGSASSLLRGLYSQSAMLGGLMLAHRGEEALGLRAAASWEANLTDSLATLAQFAVAGRLSQAALGRNFSASLRQLEVQAQYLPETPRPSLDNFPSNFAMEPALALAGASPAPRGDFGREGPRLGLVMAMSAHGRKGKNGTLTGRRFDQLVEPDLSRAAETFRPRRPHSAPKRIRNIGILTSGGDGPGENAAIHALVRGATQHYGWRVMGILDGYRGLIDPSGRIRELKLSDVQGHQAISEGLRWLYDGRSPPALMDIYIQASDISVLGGTLLRSSRTNPLSGDPGAEAVKRTMQDHGIDALVVIGGNGSMRAAAELQRAGVPLVGLPQSIDGDVWGSEHSIGFPSAVAKGASEVHHYLTTAYACRRWFILEVMGQRYGLLTLAVADRSKVTDGAFIEVPRPIEELGTVIESRLPRQHGVILVSEGVKFSSRGVGLIEPPRGADGHGRLINEPGDVARWIRRLLAERRIETQTRSESLGYLLRGANPVYADQVLAEQLSLGALKAIQVGSFGRMVGTAFEDGGPGLKLQSVRLSEVAKNEKEIPIEYYDLVRQRLEGSQD